MPQPHRCEHRRLAIDNGRREAHEAMPLARTTRLLTLLGATLLTACASAPPAPPAADETSQQIAERWGASFRTHWQFLHAGHTYGLGAIATGPAQQQADRLVFVDGQLACAPAQDIEGIDWYWVSQPDGLAYLAGRLETACGRGTPVPPRTLRDATARVQLPPVKVEEIPASEEPASLASEMGGALLGSLAIGVGLILSPVALAAAPVVVGAAKATESDRARVTLGMPWSDAQRILGAPDVSFPLPAASTEVQSYLGMVAETWHAGVVEGRVIWTSRANSWLDHMARWYQDRGDQREQASPPNPR
jgi:hypothetical protein